MSDKWDGGVLTPCAPFWHKLYPTEILWLARRAFSMKMLGCGMKSNGQYSSASAYTWLKMQEPSSSSILESTWVTLWKQKIPEKVIFFIWLLLNDRLGTN